MPVPAVDAELLQALRSAPSLWPVYVSQKSNVAAFVDHRQRLGIIGVNIGVNLGRPLAVGLRAYVILTVVAEMVWEQENYATYDRVLDDERVRTAGEWDPSDPPRHPLIALYEQLRAFRIDT
jgi:hypothetical protein